MEDPCSNLQSEYKNSIKKLQFFFERHKPFIKKYYQVKVPKRLAELDENDFVEWIYSIKDKFDNVYSFDIEYEIINLVKLNEMLKQIDNKKEQCL